MERLISLFREPDYEQWSPSLAHPPAAAQDEPLYFQQLLEYLREQKSRQRVQEKDAAAKPSSN